MADKRLTLRIAAISMQVTANGEFPFRLRNTFPGFIRRASRADLRLVLSQTAAGKESPIPRAVKKKWLRSAASLSGTGSELLAVRRVQERLEKCLSASAAWALELKPDAVSIIDFSNQRSDIFYSGAGNEAGPGIHFGAIMFAAFLPRFDALMLHASAVVRHGRAAVFLAPDEGGKTTAARLDPRGIILGDDQVVVRRRGGRFRAWGTPWGLHASATQNAPLGGLFLLKKARRFALAPFPAHRLVPLIWREIQAPLAILPQPLKQKAFHILCDIARSVPCWTLSFPRTHIDWKAVDDALQEKEKRRRCRNVIDGLQPKA